MKLKLSNFTILALTCKKTIAGDMIGEDPESDADWQKCCNELEKVLAAPTVEVLASSKKSMGELENYLCCNEMGINKEKRAILRDLCWAGYFEKYDSNVISTRKIKTTTVAGVKYNTGEY